MPALITSLTFVTSISTLFQRIYTEIIEFDKIDAMVRGIERGQGHDPSWLLETSTVDICAGCRFVIG